MRKADFTLAFVLLRLYRSMLRHAFAQSVASKMACSRRRTLSHHQLPDLAFQLVCRHLLRLTFKRKPVSVEISTQALHCWICLCLFSCIRFVFHVLLHSSKLGYSFFARHDFFLLKTLPFFFRPFLLAKFMAFFSLLGLRALSSPIFRLTRIPFFEFFTVHILLFLYQSAHTHLNRFISLRRF